MFEPDHLPRGEGIVHQTDFLSRGLNYLKNKLEICTFRIKSCLNDGCVSMRYWRTPSQTEQTGQKPWAHMFLCIVCMVFPSLDVFRNAGVGQGCPAECASCDWIIFPVYLFDIYIASTHNGYTRCISRKEAVMHTTLFLVTGPGQSDCLNRYPFRRM